MKVQIIKTVLLAILLMTFTVARANAATIQTTTPHPSLGATSIQTVTEFIGTAYFAILGQPESILGATSKSSPSRSATVAMLSSATMESIVSIPFETFIVEAPRE